MAREADPADRRTSHMVITDSGLAVVAQVREAGRGWLAAQLPNLTESEVEVLAAAVPSLERLLDTPDDTQR